VTFPPSPAVHALLQKEYAKCRSSTTPASDRLVALVYCWYFGWIQDIYVNLADGRREWCKWTLACALVTLVTIVCLGLMAMCGHLLVVFLSRFLYALINFLLFVIVLLGLVVAALTICSFVSSEHKPKQQMLSRKSPKCVAN
jgi:MFS family permease